MPGEANREGGSVLCRGRDVNGSAVRRHDLAGDVQAEPDAARLPLLLRFGRGAADQRVEDRGQGVGRDRRAPVADREQHVGAIGFDREIDRAGAGPVLHRVPEQVGDHLTEAGGVPFSDGSPRGSKRSVSVGWAARISSTTSRHRSFKSIAAGESGIAPPSSEDVKSRRSLIIRPIEAALAEICNAMPDDSASS